MLLESQTIKRVLPILLFGMCMGFLGVTKIFTNKLFTIRALEICWYTANANDDCDNSNSNSNSK